MNPTVLAAIIGVGGTVIVAVAGFWASVRNTSKTTALALRCFRPGGSRVLDGADRLLSGVAAGKFTDATAMQRDVGERGQVPLVVPVAVTTWQRCGPR